jgi:hypothetical protein
MVLPFPITDYHLMQAKAIVLMQRAGKLKPDLADYR